MQSTSYLGSGLQYATHFLFRIRITICNRLPFGQEVEYATYFPLRSESLMICVATRCMEPGLRPFNPLCSPISVWWPAWRIDFQSRPAAVDPVAPALSDHMRDPCVRRLTARPRLSSSTGQLAGKGQKDRRGPWMLKGQDCTCTCCSNVFHTGWSYGALLQVSMSLQDASNDRSRVSELSHVRGLVLAGFTQLPPDGSVAASIPAILHDTSAPFRLKESWFQTQSRRSNSKPVPTVSARAGDIVLPNEGNADFRVTHP